ncbi:MAG TPA: hypothetical protein VLX29_07725 [Nitrospirota bacterium]|nr:hypothetical protein [Nitrospirota bacterium]
MKMIFITMIMPLVILLTGCSGMHTAEVAKYDNYRQIKKIAFAPTAYKKEFVAERMDRINYLAMEKSTQQGYTIVSVDQIRKLLGKNFKTFEKEPMNAKMVRQITRKFDIEALVSCEINECQQDVAVKDRPGYVLNKVSLTYTMYDIKTRKPIAKISGSNENTDLFSEESVIGNLAKELAAKLIKSL